MSELPPTLEEFRKLAVERRVIPVYRRLLAGRDGHRALSQAGQEPSGQLPARIG